MNYKLFFFSEHWTSILTYWWIGLGMIAITTFIIYNTLFSIAQLQPTNTRPTKYAGLKTITHTIKPLSPPGVFMHVFVNDKEEDLNKYLPYIEVFANKYKDFTYNLIIVRNDTNEETSNLPDEINNNIALNSLWSNDVNYGNVVPSNSNIQVKYVTLTKYLNDSPLKKHWTTLPPQFIRFLVRAISVWDKGGIAINPIILTPQSPHASYIEKFVSIIKNFKKNNGKIDPERKQELIMNKHNKLSPKVNNIRDIINALEREESSDYPDKEILHASESRTDMILTNKKNQLMSVAEQNELTNSLNIKTQYPGKLHESDTQTSKTKASDQSSSTEKNKSENSSNLLPLFMEYLFHNKKTKSYDTTHSMKKRRSSKMNEVANIVENHDLQMRNFWNDIMSTDNYKPMIVSAKGIRNNTASNYTKRTHLGNEKLFELTVDLKGNIIATDTPCHAFIGNVFTNAIHHDESESLTDFIIKELSIFCKGLLASCVGIDVILV